MSFKLAADPADLSRNHDERDTNHTDDQSQRTHRPEIAVDVKMIQQRPERLRARRIEEHGSAELAQKNRCENYPAGEKAGTKQRQQNASKGRHEAGAASHRSLRQIVVQLNNRAGHRAQAVRQESGDIGDHEDPQSPVYGQRHIDIGPEQANGQRCSGEGPRYERQRFDHAAPGGPAFRRHPGGQ